jgi:hypothetical protein
MKQQKRLIIHVVPVKTGKRGAWQLKLDKQSERTYSNDPKRYRG